MMVVYIVIFPFTANPAAIHWQRDMKLTSGQRAAILTAGQIIQTAGNDHRFIFADPYLSEALKIDPFNPALYQNLTPDYLKNSRPGDIIIWENWFAFLQNGGDKRIS